MDAAPSDRASASIASRTPWLRVGAAYLGIAVVMTLPLALHFRTALPAGLDDVWQNYWNFWWWKTALLELRQSPFFASTLFFPSGGDAVLHTHSPFNMIVALPITVLLGPAAAYNFCVLLALTLAGLSAYALTLDLTQDRRAAFLSGLVFAFFPNTLEQTHEHLNHFSTQFVPVSLMFFLRLRRGGRSLDAVALGVCFALNALADWHLGLALGVLIASLTLFEMARRAGRFGALLILAAVVAGVLTLPAAAPLLATVSSGDGAPAIRSLGTVNHGADLAFLWLPPADNPFLGFLTASVYASSRRFPNAGFVCYLGYTALLLAGIALIKDRRARPWFGIFLAFLVLSLGATLHWLGRPISGAVMPFRLIEHVPILNLAREANHFLVLVGLALAVLAGLGWAALGPRSRGSFAAACGLVLFECAVWPYPVREIRVSPYHQRLATSALGGAVLDIPFTADGRLAQNMRYQVIHGRPIAGGYLSITPGRPALVIRRDALLSQLHGFAPTLDAPPSPQAFRQRGFGCVILHKNKVAPTGRLPDRHKVGDFIPQSVYRRLRRLLEEGLGPPAYEDAQLVAFEIRGAEARLPRPRERREEGLPRP